MLPQIDWFANALRRERHRHFASQSGGRVRGVQYLLHDPTSIAIGDRRLFPAHAPCEVTHFLWEPVIPVLLEYWIGPPARRRRLFDRVSESDLRIRGQGVTHEHVCVRLALVA